MRGSIHFGRISMRGRMMILIAAAMLPLAGFLGFSIASDYEATLLNARKNLMQAANLAAARQARVFVAARLLLDTIRLSPSVTVGGGPECERILAAVKDANPQFISFGVLDAQGQVTCHNSLRVRQAFTDSTLIQRVMAAGAPDFIVGNFIIGRVTKKPTVAVAVALRDVFGQKVGAVFAALDLDRLARAAEGISLGGRRTVMMVQPATGRMLTHYPQGLIALGAVFADHPLMNVIRASPAGGVSETIGFMGRERITGFSPVEGAETSGIMLAVGESTAELLAPVRRQATWWIAAASLAFATALGAAWWLGDRLQLRPIARLTLIAGRIGAGDDDVRADMETWQSPELRELAQTLNRMAAHLAAGREAERNVAASEARYRLLSENTADLVTCIDADGRRSFVSPASAELLGLTPAELIGKRPIDIAHPDDRPIVEEMMRKLKSGTPVTGLQYRQMHRDGRSVWVEVSGRPTENAQIVFAVRDITARRQMEDELADANRKLAALASTDALTGLLNRRAFDDALADAFAYSVAERYDLSLLMIDVDRFKSFNDKYGHTAGDDCLRRVAAELRTILRRPGVSVARYGGEEFAVILPDATLSDAVGEAEALRFAMHRLGMKHEASEHGIVTLSIGVVTFAGGRTAMDAVDLVRTADHALYAAKAGGRNRTEIGLSSLAMVS